MKDTGDKHVGDNGSPAHGRLNKVNAKGMEVNHAHERFVAAVQPKRVTAKTVAIR